MKPQVRLALTLALAVAGDSTMNLRAAEATRKPNVVFIMADDLGYGDIGPHGQKIIRTPTLDKMAAEGMRFTQHYTGSPVCAPARCVLMTGKHPGHAFVRSNSEIGPWYSFQGQLPLPASEPSMAASLKRAGYATAMFGKWGMGNPGTSGDPLKQGFDHFFGYSCQRHAHNFYPQTLTEDAGLFNLTGNGKVSSKEDLSIEPGADPNHPGSYARFTGKQYAPDLCCERAMQFIRENKDKPFFLYYPTTVPHLALQVPEDSLNEYKGKLDDKPYTGGNGYLPHQYPHAAYAAMVTRMDRDIGRLCQLVKDLGLDDNTMFIFTSDNGAVFPLSGFDPGYFHSNGDLRGYKQDIYEGGIRVPLIVRWPGHVPAGTTSDYVSGHEDWFPTLLALAGETNSTPPHLDGINFGPTLLGEKQEPRPFLYREFHGAGGQQSVRVGDWKLLHRGLHGTKNKAAAPTTELYNLTTDPAEAENVAAAHPDIVSKLQSIMDEQHVASKEFPIALLDAVEIPGAPPGDGQIAQPVVSFSDPAAPDHTFFGQQTTTGKLVLSSSNGFFDRGIRASGESSLKDAAGKEFIGPDFESIGEWNKPATTLRWHLWIGKPGKLHINSHFVVAAGDAGSKLDYSVGDDHQSFTTIAQADPKRPQGAPLTFEITRPGWNTLSIRLDSLGGKEVGQVHRLELFGPAATDARVLRARWRPAACHARFSSSTVAAPKLWVMTTRMAKNNQVSSYSPVTTPFGYFGTTFDADGTSSASANFSLWSFGANKPKPQNQWSHMLAAGSLEAEFGSFGHEGSGVKLRGDWKPFGDDTREVTLALRGEVSGPWVHWFGYYLDPKANRFRLYAAAADWNGSKPMRSLNPGAFVEQPGPPDRERSGDLVRDIQRRGWMLDENRQWHLIDTMAAGKGLAAKHWSKTPDGWFSMGMGGMVYYQESGKSVTLDPATSTKPDWLQGDQALKDLFKLPATIGPRKVTDIARTSAKVVIPLSGLDLAAGEKAVITVFYGTEDCLTFDHELGYREVKTRTWPHHTQPASASEGDNTIELRELAPDAEYHLRTLIESPRGRIWSFETDHFRTLTK